jgi:hypothetical protein
MAQYQKNFLPSQSQPWVRQIQDTLTTVESAFRSAEVNNRSRDEQLLASYNRLDKAFIQVAAASSQAQAAADVANGIINTIYVPGTNNIDGAAIAANTVNGNRVVDGTLPAGKIQANSITANQISTNYVYAGSISAGQITTGTLTGILIRSAVSGQRAEIQSNKIEFYNSFNESTGFVEGGRTSGVQAVYLQSTTGYVVIANGSSSILGGTNPNAFTVLSGNTQVNNGTFGVGDANAIFNKSITVVERITSPGTEAATTTSDANLRVFANGQFARSTATSTIEAKENIRPLEFNYKSFLDVSPVIFDYKNGIIADDTGKDVIGFIAEDFEAAGLGEMLVTPGVDESDFKSLRYAKLYMFLHKAVQEINERLERIEGANE